MMLGSEKQNYRQDPVRYRRQEFIFTHKKKQFNRLLGEWTQNKEQKLGTGMCMQAIKGPGGRRARRAP